jgi:hypothetical protein
MEPIEAALAAIALLGPGEDINYTNIARTYGVVQSTLTRRHQCVTASCSTKAAGQRALHPQQELELLKYICKQLGAGDEVWCKVYCVLMTERSVTQVYIHEVVGWLAGG